MKQLKIVVEKHPDTYVAYPLGMKGVVVGQGDIIHKFWLSSVFHRTWQCSRQRSPSRWESP